METKKYILNYCLYAILFFLLFIAIKSMGQTQQPKEQINVEKEMDENGNTIRYDSTYSWSWSGESGDLIPDSIIQRFNSNFDFDFDFDTLFHPSFPDFSTHFDHSMDLFFEDEHFKKLDEMMKRQNQMFEELFKDGRNTIPQGKQQKYSSPPAKSKDIRI